MNKRYDYFYGNETDNFTFIPMPKILFKDPQFDKLSIEAKVLYSMMLDRTSLSTQNKWFDDEDRVYIIYTLEQVMDDLKCWKEKANKTMKELKELGLIESIRRGLGLPNIIYVMNFATDLKYSPKSRKESETYENMDSFENRTSEVRNSNVKSPKFKPSQNLKSNASHIDRNKNNINNNNGAKSMSGSDSTSHQNLPEEKLLTNDVDTDVDSTPAEKPIIKQNIKQPSPSVKQNNNAKDIPPDNQTEYDYDIYKNIIRKNISYDHFKQHSDFREIRLVDELVECMLDVITTQGKKVKINSELKNRQLVINKYLSVHASDIKHILMKYQEQEGKITHVSSYLKTLLYTTKQERDFFYANQHKFNSLLL